MKNSLLKVVIVDDEAIICDGLKNYFDWEGAGTTLVAAFRSAASAIEYIRENPVDILVTDINMKGMSGITLVEQLCEIHKAVRVIFISAYTEFEYAYQAVKFSCVDDYVLKPIDPDELKRALKKAAAKLRSEAKRPFPPLPQDACVFYRSDPVLSSATAIILLELKRAEGESFEKSIAQVTKLLEDRGDALEIFRYWACELLVQSADTLATEGITVDEREILASCREITGAQTIEQTKSCLCRQMKKLLDTIHGYQNNRYSAICIRAVEIVEREYTNPNFSMQMLADELSVSANYISARFKKEIGVGFSRYLNNLRMECAKKMLSETDKKVFEICRCVGINDVRYFTRVFKASVGITPIEFRNLAEVKRVIRSAESGIKD